MNVLKKLSKQSKKIDNMPEECIKENHFDSTESPAIIDLLYCVIGFTVIYTYVIFFSPQ